MGQLDMIETLFVFGLDTFIGELTHDSLTDKYEFKPVDNPSEDALEFLDLWNLATNADKPDKFKETLLNSRVVPKNQAGLDKTLTRLGLTEYDAWRLMKINKLQSNDMFWASENKNPDEFWKYSWLAKIQPEYNEKIAEIKKKEQARQTSKQ